MGPGHLPETDIGPMISPDAKARALSIVESSVTQGAVLSLDGRAPHVLAGYEKVSERARAYSGSRHR